MSSANMEANMPERRECRCCRKPIPAGMLACKPHWFMLPNLIRQAVMAAYQGGAGIATRAYVDAVTKADDYWKSKHVWKPGVPQGGD